MSEKQLNLLRKNRFLPFFITQSLGAFNDNLYKNAIVFLVTFGLASNQGIDPKLLVPLAGGVFILPFFLFSAIAGQVADSCDKTKLIRVLKFLEIIVMILAAIAFVYEDVFFLIVLLFLMGLQSTFFGPVKFSILPSILNSDELISGNALVEAGTFVAILLGASIAKVVLEDDGPFIISGIIILVAFSGYISSLNIPSITAASPDLKIKLNPFTETKKILSYCYSKPDLFLLMLAISWFWFVGSIFLIVIPTLSKDILGGDQNLVAFFMIVFSVGIGFGSLLCNRLLKGQIQATYAPLGTFGICLFSIDLYFSMQNINPTSELISVIPFLENGGWRSSLDVFLIALSGGVFVVPLQAMLQQRSNEFHRSRNIAANNIINAFFMIIAAISILGLYQLGITSDEVILILGLLNGVVTLYITRLFPGSLSRAFIAWILDLFYRVEVSGLEHFHAAGKKVLIVSNHQSFLDPALISSYLPSNVTFAINTKVSKNIMVKFFMRLAKTISIDPTSSLSMRSLIDAVNNNEKVVIFPEGRITVTGAMMKIYEGPGMIADKAGAVVLPVRIEGAQYSSFSRFKGKVKTRLFPKIKITFLPAHKFDAPDELKGRARRQYSAKYLQEIMTHLFFESSNYKTTLFQSLLNARQSHGGKHNVLEDEDRKPMNYDGLIVSSLTLGRVLIKGTKQGSVIGLMLPNTSINIITFFALSAYGRVPAMIDFSKGVDYIVSSCEIAEINQVYTSKAFIKINNLEQLITALRAKAIDLRYIEDIDIQLKDKVLGFLGAKFDGFHSRLGRSYSDAGKPAAILFSSDKNDDNKAVVLSHINILSNQYQLRAMIDFLPTDIVFNALPLYQAFSLNSATLLSLFTGMKVFLYSSMASNRMVSEVVYDLNATLIFSNNALLSSYARFAHAYDFFSVRYVLTHSDKVKESTRQQWLDRFGIRIFEGYGSAESTSLISVNSPMLNEVNSVGQLVPGIECRIDKVPKLNSGGHLFVKGPSIMMGYMQASNKGIIQSPIDGWYDTGTIAELNNEGFLNIKD